METLSALKIQYMDKREVTLQTDCQAIINLYDKISHHKSSRVRWANFVDFITGTGVEIKFKHIDGKHNVLADSLCAWFAWFLQINGRRESLKLQHSRTAWKPAKKYTRCSPKKYNWSWKHIWDKASSRNSYNGSLISARNQATQTRQASNAWRGPNIQNEDMQIL